MDKLRRMAIFAAVVDAGSMTAAARRLGITPSAVSQHVKQLEQSLGLALLHRSTRSFTLTEAGARYHVGCAAMVAAANDAEQALARLRDEPEGELRLAAPIGFSTSLATALAPLRVHPRLNLCLMLSDTRLEVVNGRVDIALRLGLQADSSLVARKLGSLPWRLCASPSYLAERGWPVTPDDLLQHDWLGETGNGEDITTLHFSNMHGETRTVQLKSRIKSSQLTAQNALCVAGWGISVDVTHDRHQTHHDSRLLPILPGWRLPDLPVYAVTPRRGEQPAKVRYALELLAAHFR